MLIETPPYAPKPPPLKNSGPKPLPPPPEELGLLDPPLHPSSHPFFRPLIHLSSRPSIFHPSILSSIHPSVHMSISGADPGFVERGGAAASRLKTLFGISKGGRRGRAPSLALLEDPLWNFKRGPRAPCPPPPLNPLVNIPAFLCPPASVHNYPCDGRYDDREHLNVSQDVGIMTDCKTKV